ncbi:MAG: nitroreductase [Myxococcota bacterium]
MSVSSQLDHLIGDQPIRLEHVAAPLTVWPVMGAHEFIVAIAPKTYSRLAVIDVGRSLQEVVLETTRMGLATCWIGPGADQKSIVTHLGEHFRSDEDHVICVCAVGYASWIKPLTIRLMQATQHKRLPLSSLFFAGPRFQEPLDTAAAPLSDFGRCYEVCRWC